MAERRWAWAVSAEATGITSVVLFALGGRGGRPFAAVTLIGCLVLLLGWLRHHDRRRASIARSTTSGVRARLRVPTPRGGRRAKLEAEVRDRDEKLERLRLELETARETSRASKRRLEQELAELRTTCASHQQALLQERQRHANTVALVDQQLQRHQRELTELEQVLPQPTYAALAVWPRK
jgi:chromosome segregation ATPase